MAKITFEKDGVSFSDEGPMSEIMNILIDYMHENDLRVENSVNESLITTNGALTRYSDNFVTYQERNPFGKFFVEG